MRINKKSGIYKITNLVNQKIYIGKAVDTKDRWYSHKSYFKSGKHCNKHLQRAWDKYGEENFKYEIIEYCGLDILEEREKYWIKYHNTNLIGYNMTLGGEGALGRIVTEEHREKLRKANKGKQRPKGFKHTNETKEKISKAVKGRIMSIEQRKFISNMNKGKKISDEHKEKIRQYRIGKKYSEEQKYNMSKLHRGELNSKAKLTDQNVKEIKILLEEGVLRVVDIAKKFNVSQQAIHNIKSNRQWKHVTI